ncbi:MAG: class I SAM-dependent methyltransferase [Nanoarchaeota archaeon]|nr:class I SAM-dependent methyltransferase [Nanoarchaeota archaeon]
MEESEYTNIFLNEEKHWWYIGMRSIFFQLTKKQLKKSKKILDIGCGCGYNMQILNKFSEVHGIDISNKALKYCKQRGLKNLKLASIEKIPYKDNSFDFVTCFDVIYHNAIKDDVKALKEINRILEKKGKLFIRVPALDIFKGNHDETVHTRERYTKEKLKNRLEHAGFKIDKISYTNFFLSPIVLVMRQISDKKSDISIPSPFVNNILKNILKIEGKMLKHINLPFGVSLIAIARKR